MRIRLSGSTEVIGLRYFEPAVDLRGLVSSYYIFRADVPRIADLMRADMGQLRFILRGSGDYHMGGYSFPVDGAHLLGPSNGATRFDVVGPVLVFGIGLHPAGWATLVRDDAGIHADRATDATALLGALMADMLDALRNAADTRAMIAIADAVMRALRGRGGEPPFGLTRTIDAWLIGAPDPDVDTLVTTLGISARHVERLTKRFYGAPPKLLARKYRTLRAASLIGTTGVHWSDAAGDAYFDQSHFIRDFKRFAGVTPSQFQHNPSPVTRLTLQRRDVPGEITPLARIS